MDDGAGFVWRWSEAKTVKTPSSWELVPQAEATLLEHAYLQAWARLELTIDDTNYVIEPFLSNGAANIATPIDNPTGPVLLLTRTPSLVDRQEKESRSTSISILRDLTHPTPRATPSANSTASVAVDCEGFRLVRRRGRRHRPVCPVANENQQNKDLRGGAQHGEGAQTQKMTLWRAFPKVDFGACGDSSLVRQILVDGIDVALQHAGKRRLSPAGISLAVAHFMELSFPVRVIIPHWLAHDAGKHPHLFTEPPELLIQALREDDLLVVLPDPDEPTWKPSLASFRTVKDVEHTIELCKTFNAAFCSNDFFQFLHMMEEGHPRFNDYLYISSRSCLYAFDGEGFYHILDSQGRGRFVDTLFFRNAKT